MIPAGVPLRVVGDVHGDARAFALAAETDRYIVQLGDLVDDGPDTPGALAIMFRLIDEQRGMFLLGNHDFKLARGLLGHRVTGSSVERSLVELPLAMHKRTLQEIMDAPAWVATPRALFVHGGFHPAMRRQAPPPFPTRRPDPLLARALFGQTTGRATEAGKPERLLDWIEDIPAGITVYCGHDRRSQDGRPYIRDNILGGSAVFLDTGAGKGGHLSWMDIEPV
jgi:protein phosphatase